MKKLLSKQSFCSLINKKIIDDKIIVLTLNNLKKNNSLSSDFLSELESNISSIQNCKQSRVVIINSSHPKIFCAGADLKERIDMKEDDIRKFVLRLRTTFYSLAKLNVPTIAAINGFALGGGLELALSCDIRLATKKSTLGLTETALGIIPGAGGTQNLSRVVGLSKAKELIYTATRLQGEDALKIGLINHLFENNEEMEKKSIEI
jgi:methylglutaconyl-CoA hydratase